VVTSTLTANILRGLATCIVKPARDLDSTTTATRLTGHYWFTYYIHINTTLRVYAKGIE
jgi:hypothetical protein